MVEYSKGNIKLSDTQLKKLKTAAKNKTGTTLRMSLKMLDWNDLTHELLLTTRQKTKLGNALNNNMSTNINLSKDEIFKIIQSGGFLGSLLSKIASPFMKVAVPLAKKYFSSTRNHCFTFSNLCSSSKGNARFWNNFNNFKQRNKWYNKNCPRSWRF